MKAIWDEVQGACDAARVQQSLQATSERPLLLDGWTPLHYACENRSVDDATRAACIRALARDPGVDVNAVDENGWTALHVLAKNKHAEELSSSLQVLLASGAKTALTTTDLKKSALHLLCENDVMSVAALNVLVKASDVNAVDADGNTALHYLAENQSVSIEALGVLLLSKANPNAQNQFQSTPFHSLCQHNRLFAPIVKLMLQHKANANVPNNIGNTAFHYACENYSLTLEILSEFVNSKQVNLTATNSLGKTALDLIPPHKQDCLALAQKIGAPSLGSTATLSNAKQGVAAGGEDASELPSPALITILSAWNASLPPIDMAFYNAVCCEPAFAAQYEQLQDISVQVCETPGDAALVKSWELALAKWRLQLLLAFTALVSPDLWESYADKYNRVVPSDITKVRASITDVWAKFPGPSHRRERLESLGLVFK